MPQASLPLDSVQSLYGMTRCESTLATLPEARSGFQKLCHVIFVSRRTRDAQPAAAWRNRLLWLLGGPMFPRSGLPFRG